MAKKKNDAAIDAVTSLLGAAEKSIKEVTAQAKTPTVKTLEDLKALYETVDVRIRKRDMKTGKFAHLVTMDRESPKVLEAMGLEELCKDQAGGGEYQVWIRDPSAKTWSSALKFDGILISGPGYEIAKKDRHGMDAGFPGGLPSVTSNTGPSNWAFQSKNNELKDTLKQQMDQSMGMNDRMLMLMQNNNQQQMQMMQGFMAAMMGGGQNSQQQATENAELRALKERLERMEQDRRQEERFGAQQKEISELKQQLLMAMAGPKSDKNTDLMLALMTGQQNNAQAATNQYLELVKEIMQRPGEDEKLSNLTGTMMRSFQGQMELMTSAMQSGLLNNGGSEHPIAQIISQAVEGLTQVGTAMVEGRGQEEPGYDTAPVEVGPMPAFDPQQQDAAALGYTAPDPQLMAPPEVEEPEVPAAPEPPEEDLTLTDKDYERISRDTATNKILATIQNGIQLCEATARIYAHARSGNTICVNWLKYPDIMSEQILTRYSMEQAIEPLTQDIVNFIDFMSNDGNPNEWSKVTGYEPIKEPKNPSVTSVIPPLEQPEFGVTKGAPQQGEVYDSEHPNSITPPPVVEETQPVEADATEVPEPVSPPTEMAADVEEAHQQA